MKQLLLSLLMGALCLGLTGCDDDDDEDSSSSTAGETNAPAVNEGSSSSSDSSGGLTAPAAATTVTGRWIGFCKDGGEQFALSLKLTQTGEAVTGSYAFWPDTASSPVLSGSLSDENTFLLAIKRNDILFNMGGLVDFAAATISGTWEDEAGSSGTFSLNKWE